MVTGTAHLAAGFCTSHKAELRALLLGVGRAAARDVRGSAVGAAAAPELQGVRR